MRLKTTYAGWRGGRCLPTVDFAAAAVRAQRETPNLGALRPLRQTDNDKVLADNPALMLALLAAITNRLATPGILKSAWSAVPDPLDPEDVEWHRAGADARGRPFRKNPISTASPPPSANIRSC
jgi:hypothetical protein